ncbi:DUF1838 family protein [Phenylobacterium sp.]|jgi:hypothetical protein|uniref:DUF1838 family protein n=1 Tax=Phenylobacterium sp. TaxID=1871053 RepID=UPI0037CCBFFC
MKSLLFTAALAALLPMAVQAQSSRAPKLLNLAKPEEALQVSRKFQCSMKDNEPVVYHWSGRGYSKVPGEPDRLLFLLEGMNVRACVTVNDPVRGVGYRMVSRELMFYLDPATGKPLRTWKNPWTGQEVEVWHVANDPVNSRPTYVRGANGEPFTMPTARVENGRVFMPIEVPLFYNNPLAGDYQQYVGNQYHAMEIFNFNAEASDILDPKKNLARPAVAWVRLAQWLPWMQMNSRAGMLVFNAVGQTVENVDALPQVIKDEIAASYPAYRTPPPGDDARPNETSWTYFKKQIEAKKAKGAGAAPSH